MEQLLFSGLLIIAGLSGLMLLASKSKRSTSRVKLLLSFSGAFLLGICVLHLIPEVYGSDVENVGLYILAGFLVQLLLEYFSRGLEHGHSHPHGDAMGQLPLGAVISLYFHALLEGMPLSHGVGHESEAGNLLAGVVLHKIPVSFALVAFLLGSKVKTTKLVIVILLFALMAPLGYLAHESGILTGLIHTESLSTYILAVVIGMLLHISTTILFESTENHRFNIIKFATVIAGSVLAFLAS